MQNLLRVCKSESPMNYNTLFDTKTLESLLDVAVVAAKKASSIIQSHGHSSYKKWIKNTHKSPSSSIVTEVDFACQEIILQVIAPTIESFALAVLAEESVDQGLRQVAPAFWCIDPLDGTLPFTEQKPGYSVSIALVAQNGTPLLGVVVDPSRDLLYTAVRGRGAYRNGVDFLASKSSTSMHHFCDRSTVASSNFPWLQEQLQQIAHECGFAQVETVVYAGGVLNALWTIENAPACFIKFPRKTESGGSLWDYAASACIVQEAGGSVCDFMGAPLELNRKESTFLNHRGVIYCSDSRLKSLLLQKLSTESI